MEIFSEINPQEVSIKVLQEIVTNEVEIKLLSKCYRGWVQSIDPLTRSFFLMKFDDQNKCSEVALVPGYSINFIKIFKGAPSQDMLHIMDSMFRKKDIHYSKEELNARREALSVWLSGNRVPFTITDNLSIEVLKVATIKPPYSTESIRCKNEVVLDKVIKLVESAPGLKDEGKT